MAGPLYTDFTMETSTTTGTGTYTLAGAVTGFQTFANIGNANTCYYAAQAVDAGGVPTGGWEQGLGTYTSAGTTLARTSVLKSSNSNNAVDWAAGTKRIMVVAPALIYPGPITAWTPGVSFGGGTTGITYSAQIGRYRIISDKTAWFTFRVALSSNGSSTGNMLITGFPFTFKNSGQSDQIFAPYATALTGTDIDAVFGICVFNSTTARMDKFTKSLNAAAAMDDADTTDTSLFMGTGVVDIE